MDNNKYIALNFFSNKINIKIIGAGKGAAIKAKTFCTNGCSIEVLSRDFSEEILSLKDYNIKYIKGNYYKDFLVNCHIVLIAVDDKELCKTIIKDCEDLNKIYIDSTEFKNGMGVIPSQRNLNNLSFSVSTKVGVPKISKLLGDKIENSLKEYDEFTLYISKLRKRAKNEKLKKEIINFICTDDFKFFYDKNKDKIVFRMFFEESITNSIYAEDIN
ncbi:MAG: NAD(P)-dependent oxidoreductase [Clostridium perfringens]|nr:NAD(P)-dependent oxidoreductase [Clostridium perfringens]